MAATKRLKAFRSIAAILISLFGGSVMFNWFMLPKDIYFWRLNLWPFFVLPASAGVIAWFVHPRSTPATKRLANALAVIYSVVFGLFLLSLGTAFVRNKTHKCW